MPYHKINIQRISKAQILKLLKGKRIRVKHGNHHTIHVSKEQHKKIMSAHVKGQGVNIEADPYQIELLKGSGVFGNIGHAISSIAHSPITQGIVHHAAPIVMDLGKKYIERQLTGHGMHHHHGHHHGEGMHSHHHMHGCGDSGGLSSHAKRMDGEGIRKRRKSHSGGSLSGGALMAGGYGEGARKAVGRRRVGHGINGHDVLNGLVKYGVPALQTAAMFL